jgi:hypothetical protein
MKFASFRKYRAVLWPALLAGTITWSSGQPAAVPDLGWFQADKLGHFAAYGALATGIVRINGLARWPLLGGWWALVLASGYGLGDEYRQAWGGVRFFDLADWAADTVGAITAVVLYLRWSAYRRLMEYPLRWRRAKRRVEIASEPVPTSAP